MQTDISDMRGTAALSAPDMTKPSKPSMTRRCLCSVSSFSHVYTPLIRLYPHMIDPTPASTAAAKGGW